LIHFYKRCMHESYAELKFTYFIPRKIDLKEPELQI